MGEKTVFLNGHELNIEVAKSRFDQAIGLAGQESLCGNCAMLFVYSDSQVRHFWMKGMKFPLDFIWLEKNKVVGLTQNVPTRDEQGEITRVVSLVPADMVLEVSDGFIKDTNIAIGDTLTGF